MRNKLLDLVEKSSLKEKPLEFARGDTVDVHCKIKEGDKNRIQIFSGTVLSVRGSGTNKTFIVRRIVANEGVERIFPANSPAIDKIVVKRSGEVRRAKLFYLRDRVGKSTRLSDKKASTKPAKTAPAGEPALAGASA